MKILVHVRVQSVRERSGVLEKQPTKETNEWEKNDKKSLSGSSDTALMNVGVACT